MAFFSVIIPIYNSSKFLEKCLKSILDQSFSDFELILVDDGSSDDSESICSFFAEKDDRILFLKQYNSGPGSARNKGMEL